MVSAIPPRDVAPVYKQTSGFASNVTVYHINSDSRAVVTSTYNLNKMLASAAICEPTLG